MEILRCKYVHLSPYLDATVWGFGGKPVVKKWNSFKYWSGLSNVRCKLAAVHAVCLCHVLSSCFFGVKCADGNLLCMTCFLGAVPFSAGSFFVYINLDKIWREPVVHFTPLQNFINGCVAAGVAQTLSFPFETVKRKMQVQSIDVASILLEVPVSGAWDKVSQMINTATLLHLPIGYRGFVLDVYVFCCCFLNI